MLSSPGSSVGLRTPDFEWYWKSKLNTCGRRLSRVSAPLVVVVVVVVVVITFTCVIKSVVTGQATVTLELRNTRGKNTNNPRWYTRISQLTQFMAPPETYKSEIGSQSTMCQVHTGAYYVSLLTPGELVITPQLSGPLPLLSNPLLSRPPVITRSAISTRSVNAP